MKMSEFKKGMIVHTEDGKEHVIVDDLSVLYDTEIETYYSLRIVKVTYGERTVYEGIEMSKYGGEKGLYELTVLDDNGNLDYTTPITNDVIGWLTWEEVI